MKAKARENLDSALILLRAGRLNASASRLYFAVFQAEVYSLQLRGRKPQDFRNARYWDHDTVRDAAHLARGEAADRLLLEKTRRLRLQADYEREHVRRRDIERPRREACRFVMEVTE
ncbi:MAG: hypothetical protein L0323_08800 [Planctomycetes bacterium]|nr:hypothetical protein [Planctomycetota bacterium]